MRAMLSAALLALALPAMAQTTLKVVPQTDLRVVDPVWTTAQITQNHANMVYDTLFASTETFEIRPQMVESWTRSDDGMTWRFTLRPGLRFHDGSPVRAADAVASIRRWAARSAPGTAMMERASALVAEDERRFTLAFARKFGPVLEVLGAATLPPFIMREAEANTDPFKQIAEVVGSGPFVFVKDEHRPGAKVVYRRFDGYVPRGEPNDAYAGGKHARVERVEWITMADAATAAAALRNGEVDYVETLPFDLLDSLRGDPSITIRVLNRAGQVGHIRPNSLQPPFDNPKGRQALTLIIDQPIYLKAIGAEGDLAKVCHAVFVCGTPLESAAAIEPWRRADKARARQLLAEAGYRGEPIVLLDPSDQPVISLIANVTAGLLREIGANVEMQTMDWGSVVTRRNAKDRAGPRSPGWHLAFTYWSGTALASPMTNVPLVSTCDGKNLYGWPCDEEIERLRDAFIEAPDRAAQMAIVDRLQARFYEVVPYVNTGMFFQPAAYSTRLRGVPATLAFVAWNIEKTR